MRDSFDKERTREQPSVSPTKPQDRLPIELLYWEGCPSHPEALALLRAVLAERGIEPDIELREVRTHEEAETLAFPGSPTIRIRGRDVDPLGAKAQPALACRIYRLPDGRVSPVPSREQLEEALR
jgi:hypothetical protein